MGSSKFVLSYRSTPYCTKNKNYSISPCIHPPMSNTILCTENRWATQDNHRSWSGLKHFYFYFIFSCCSCPTVPGVKWDTTQHNNTIDMTSCVCISLTAHRSANFCLRKLVNAILGPYVYEPGWRNEYNMRESSVGGDSFERCRNAEVKSMYRIRFWAFWLA